MRLLILSICCCRGNLSRGWGIREQRLLWLILGILVLIGGSWRRRNWLHLIYQLYIYIYILLFVIIISIYIYYLLFIISIFRVKIIILILDNCNQLKPMMKLLNRIFCLTKRIQCKVLIYYYLILDLFSGYYFE